VLVSGGTGTGKTFLSSQLGRKGPPRGSPIWSCAIKRKPPSPRPRPRSEQPSFLLYMSSANPAAASFANCSRLVEASPLGPERRCGGAASQEACNRCSPRVLGGREGMIVRSISCRSKHGASHRKNLDTSSLGRGWRASPALRSAPLRDHPGFIGPEHPVRESGRRDRRCPGLYAPDGPVAIC
jgi:hypothetical protein